MNTPTHILKSIGIMPFRVFLNKKNQWESIVGGHITPNEDIVSLAPIEEPKEVSSPKEPETFDWKEAMKLYAEGVEIQYHTTGDWESCSKDWTYIHFGSTIKYRKKPVEPVVKEYYQLCIGNDNYVDGCHFTLENAMKEIQHYAPNKGQIWKVTTHDNVPVSVEILKP
jgi:hypothetical protein